MHDAFFAKITPESLILTANSRLTRYLHTAFDSYQQSRGLITWETPLILPLQSWLVQQFHNTNVSGKKLLTEFQESCIWQEVIQISKRMPDLIQPAQMAKLVMQAHSTFHLWNVSLDALSPYREQIEVDCLMEWITQFQQRCNQHHWVTTAELPFMLKQRDEITPLSAPHTIFLIGFDDFNPSVDALFTQLKKRVCIETVFLTADTHTKKRIVLNNTDTEIKTMAQWAKAHWENNPRARIGCVIPDLGTLRATVYRIFTEILPVETINMSAGISLAKQHMIAVALTLLKWCQQELPIAELSTLLQSPYVCHTEDEKNCGAQIDALLREQNKVTVSISDLLSGLTQCQSRYPNLQMISRWRAFIAQYHEKKSALLSPSHWAHHFIRALKAIQWPSKRTQHTTEFQVLERFKKVLMEFSQLDFIYPALNFKRALHLLTTLTQQTLFQAKSHDEPIQIMGALEASGILFDAVWIMGLHDGVWPLAAKPHPLIPHAIQQQYHMPHATAKRELQYCEHMTRRLENAATEVVFSSPASAGDQALFPSQLIHTIPAISLSELSFSSEKTPAEKMCGSGIIETCEDNDASALSDFSAIQGGSNIVKLQALCPFRAYSTIRLKATALKTPHVGISPVIKGILIHHILFDLWGELKDQDQLKQLSDTSLNLLIDEAIDKAFTENPYQKQQPHNHYFFSIEKKRLKKVIYDWLAFEKTRPYFRVLAREIECQITVDQLPLTIRMDRIDALRDGSLFLMDYKTGLNTMAGWFHERIYEPQLPLYAVFQDHSEHAVEGIGYPEIRQHAFSGIGYAEIRQGDMKFKSLIHENHLYAQDAVPGFIPIDRNKQSDSIFTWDALLHNWKASLIKLSTDFCNGVAIVDPIEPKVCETCDLKPLCRYTTQS